MQNIYTMMGLPGSGKTTWAEDKANNDESAIIVSRDDIRYISSHNYSYRKSQRHQDFVNKVSSDMLESAIGFGFDVILDQLSLTKEQREKTTKNIRHIAETFYKKVRIHLVYCTESEENVNRRMQSNMKWGDEDYYQKTIGNMKSQIETDALNREDFDRIIFVDKNGKVYKEWSKKDDLQLVLDWRTK